MVGMTCGNPARIIGLTGRWISTGVRPLARLQLALLVAQDSSHARRLRNQQPASLARFARSAMTVKTPPPRRHMISLFRERLNRTCRAKKKSGVALIQTQEFKQGGRRPTGCSKRNVLC